MKIKLNFIKEFSRLVSGSGRRLLAKTGITEIIYEDQNMAHALAKNKKKLKKILKNGANVYAIWVKRSRSGWQLMYIGQRKMRDIYTRLIDHLFKKNRKTGSQLKKIKGEIKRKSAIGITVIKVEPDELRTAVEERLISIQKKKHRCPWNMHG